MTAKLDTALISRMTGGLWREDKETQLLESEKAVPLEEKKQKPSFSFTEQSSEAEQEAKRILREAMNDPDLLDNIKERASIRWSNGRSDSLFSAVLCNLKLLNEKVERNSNGEIILKPKTDWNEELAKFSEVQ